MSDLIERPKSIGEAWRIMIQQQSSIEELEAERDFAIDHRNTARDKVEELEADRLCRCVDEVRCELEAENERLTAERDDLQYANDFCGKTIERLQARVEALETALRDILHGYTTHGLDAFTLNRGEYMCDTCCKYIVPKMRILRDIALAAVEGKDDE